LPQALRRLTNLKFLYLHDNRALDLPPEILGPTQGEVRFKNAQPTAPQEILDYYSRWFPNSHLGTQ